MIKFGPTEKSEIGVCGHIYHTKCIDQYRTAKLGKTKLQSELELIYWHFGLSLDKEDLKLPCPCCRKTYEPVATSVCIDN